MGKKRGQGKNRGPGPQQSFQQTLANMTLAKFKPYIDEQVQGALRSMASQQLDISNRLVALEETLISEIDKVDQDYLTDKVADIVDQQMGVEKVDEAAQEGDFVRIELKTRLTDQEEFQGGSYLMVRALGSGQTIGKELEGSLIGMKVGEIKETEFGEKKDFVAKIELHRVSRPIPKAEENQEEVSDATDSDEKESSSSSEAR